MSSARVSHYRDQSRHCLWPQYLHHKGDINALIDSGALGNFMPLAIAQQLGLSISQSHTVVNVGDKRCVPSAAKTSIEMSLGNRTVRENVILLHDCPYNLILGSKFFYGYKCDILYSEQKLRIRLPATQTLTATVFDLPFRSHNTPIVAACNIILQPHSETKVKVIPDPAFSLQALSEEARWGIVTGNQSENRRVAVGILRICDPDEK
jgi:hypothetical protein